MKHTQIFLLGLISYNTEPFLHATLDDMIENGLIRKYWYVAHDDYTDPITGEYRKSHYHVELMLNPCDSDSIGKLFNEPDPNNPLNPLGVIYDDVCTKLTIEKQLCHALLYDTHDMVYCQGKKLKKPYYDIPTKLFATNDKDWFNMICSMTYDYDMYWSIVPKPSEERITTAVINQEPVYTGDRVLTAREALKRHWINSFAYRNLVSADLDNMTARYTKLTYRYEELSKAVAKAEKRLQDCHWDTINPEDSPF